MVGGNIEEIMNEETLNKVAIKYCELQGLNPYEILAHGAEPSANGVVTDVLCHSHRYELIKKQIKNQVLISEAVRLVEMDELREQQTFTITGTLSDIPTFTIGSVGIGQTQLNGVPSAQHTPIEEQTGKEFVHRFFD